MKNKLQRIIKHIKTMFYNLKLCVSLKKEYFDKKKRLKRIKKCRILVLWYKPYKNYLKEHESIKISTSNMYKSPLYTLHTYYYNCKYVY